MTLSAKLRAKRWNERLKLVVTFFNVTSIGAFSLAVLAPILANLRTRSEQLGSFGPSFDSGFEVNSYAWYEGVIWPIAGLALALHLMAHILLQMLESEE